MLISPSTAKANMDVDNFLKYTYTLRKLFTEQPDQYNPFEYNTMSSNAMRKACAYKMRMVTKSSGFGSRLPGVYHTWRGIPETGDVMLLEVSMTNDDHLDNRFKDPVVRIPKVEEDESIYHLMFSDYGILID